MMHGAQIDGDRAQWRFLAVRAGLCLAIIIGGLALRGFGFGLGLPGFVVKYGGSLLWGTMVFFVVALAASRLSRRNVALISAGIAQGIGLDRLGMRALDRLRRHAGAR